MCRLEPVREFHRSVLLPTLFPLDTPINPAGLISFGTLLLLWCRKSNYVAAGRAHEGSLFPRDFIYHNRGFHQNGQAKREPH